MNYFPGKLNKETKNGPKYVIAHSPALPRVPYQALLGAPEPPLHYLTWLRSARVVARRVPTCCCADIRSPLRTGDTHAFSFCLQRSLVVVCLTAGVGGVHDYTFIRSVPLGATCSNTGRAPHGGMHFNNDTCIRKQAKKNNTVVSAWRA